METATDFALMVLASCLGFCTGSTLILAAAWLLLSRILGPRLEGSPISTFVRGMTASTRKPGSP